MSEESLIIILNKYMRSRLIQKRVSTPLDLYLTVRLCSILLPSGVTIGARHSLAQMKDILRSLTLEQPKEKTKTHQALLKHLRTLAGPQIRNMAVCSIK